MHAVYPHGLFWSFVDIRRTAMQIFLALLKTNDDWVVFIARLVLGVILFAHGAQKLLGWFSGHGFANTVKAFTTHLGLPKPVAILVIFTEFLGGLGLIAGLLTRIAALGDLVVMVGAIATLYPNGLFMNWMGDKKGHGVEYHLLTIALALVVIFEGAGALSVDRAVFQHQFQNRSDNRPCRENIDGKPRGT
jgi:putative oxidoreductase